MKTSTADLTVILPNHNHAKYLPEALGALLRQTVPPKKIIIIDDASTDNSVEVINGIISGKTTVDISLICNTTNLGVNAVCNQGLSLVTTKYVFFPAADDVCHEQIFAKSMALLLQYPQAGFCSTLSYVIDENSQIIGESYVPLIKTEPCFIQPQECRQIFRRYGSWILGHTRIFRTACLQEKHGFDEKLLSLSDLFTSIIIAGKNGACFIPELLAKYRYSVQSYSCKSSIDPIKVKQMLAIARDNFINQGDIFTKQDINIALDRWLLTFILSILRAGGADALTKALSIIPESRVRLRQLLVILQRANLLRQPVVFEVILYLAVRPYDVYRRAVRYCYRPWLNKKSII